MNVERAETSLGGKLGPSASGGRRKGVIIEGGTECGREARHVWIIMRMIVIVIRYVDDDLL